MLVMAQIASATHPRPKAASPVVGPSVITFNQCTAPNRTHGPPLAFASCNPPVQTSQHVTVGTPDANGAPANSTGSLRMKVKVGTPGPPDDSDIELTGSITDVRCKAGTAACGSANTAGGPDYTGELQGSATVRVTDHFNAVAPGGGTDPATMIDVPFPVNAACASTTLTTIGATCSIATTANAVVPGAIKDGKRANIEIGQVQIIDGGTDGLVGTAPNTLFATAGVFVP
jgi:hypothetical protein